VLFVQKGKEAEVPGYFGRPEALCRAAPFAGESKVWEEGRTGFRSCFRGLGPRALHSTRKVKSKQDAFLSAYDNAAT